MIIDVTSAQFELTCAYHDVDLELDGLHEQSGNRTLAIDWGRRPDLSNWYCPLQRYDDEGDPIHPCHFVVLVE